MHSRVVTAFRVVAFVEAVSWLGLLTGMYFKYVPKSGEAGVQMFGPIHGSVFIAYVVLTVLVSRRLNWPTSTTVLALAASIPPCFTVIFEIWAKRTGRLDEPAGTTAPSSTASA